MNEPDDLTEDQLDQLRAEVMTLISRGGTWVSAEDYLDMRGRAEKAEATLAEARAETAAVIEAAGRIAHQWDCTGSLLLLAGEVTAQDLRTAKAIAGGISRAITGLTPDHAKAALDEIKRQAREEGRKSGLREAAAVAETWVRRAMHLSPNGYEIERYHGGMAKAAANEILDLIPEEPKK